AEGTAERLGHVLAGDGGRAVDALNGDVSESDARDPVGGEMVEPRPRLRPPLGPARVDGFVAEPRAHVGRGIYDVALDDPRLYALLGQPGSDAGGPVLPVDVRPRAEQVCGAVRFQVVRDFAQHQFGRAVEVEP